MVNRSWNGQAPSRGRWLRSTGAGAILLLAVLTIRPASADHITLPSGIVIEGKAVPIHGLNERTARESAHPVISSRLPEPFWLVDDGVRYYFLPAR